MRVWYFLTLIGCLGIALISSKPLEEADDKKTKEEETYVSIEPTAEDARDEDIEASGDEEAGGEGKVYYIEVEDDESDDATVDKPIDEEPYNFLKYPEHEPDFKPYPRFAILKNGFVNHVNLDF
ncbi:uncharacterized protein LOC111066765 isoform X2 [Drosophila obscura]|uniref:uncharacterized protein LOC111066765 isoform X2 n=1 Tax=Drosophila obscura TaxID=7282 RepID=UPI001BB1BE86|nr:uncharacterized protein LOC111066765 isoform X2 [Drosophila obscura]